jgi:hypothetical protein
VELPEGPAAHRETVKPSALQEVQGPSVRLSFGGLETEGGDEALAGVFVLHQSGVSLTGALEDHVAGSAREWKVIAGRPSPEDQLVRTPLMDCRLSSCAWVNCAPGASSNSTPSWALE